MSSYDGAVVDTMVDTMVDALVDTIDKIDDIYSWSDIRSGLFAL